MWMGVSYSGVLSLFRYRTKSDRPPSKQNSSRRPFLPGRWSSNVSFTPRLRYASSLSRRMITS